MLYCRILKDEKKEVFLLLLENDKGEVADVIEVYKIDFVEVTGLDFDGEDDCVDEAVSC